jgi:hypothetical protein
VKVARYGLGTVGIAAVLFGLRGLITGGVATDWPQPAIWLVLGVLAHDLVLVPTVAAAGWVLARVVPCALRSVVRGGLLVAAVVTLVALPVLSGKGDPRNPSLTPLDYPRNWLLVLGGIAVVTTVLTIAQRFAWRPGGGRRTGSPGRSSPP